MHNSLQGCLKRSLIRESNLLTVLIFTLPLHEVCKGITSPRRYRRKGVGQLSGKFGTKGKRSNVSHPKWRSADWAGVLSTRVVVVLIRRASFQGELLCRPSGVAGIV